MTKEKYFVTKDGTIVNEYNIRMAAMIVHGIHIDTDEHLHSYIKDYAKGILFESTSPTIEDFLKNGQYVAAIKFYYDTHKDEGVTLREARDYVTSMREEMKDRGEL